MVPVIVDCALYEAGSRLDVERRMATLSHLDVHPNAFGWLGLMVPTPAELTEACVLLGIDEDVDVDEVLAPHVRPVLSFEGRTIQLVLRTAEYLDTEEVISLGEMTLIASDRAVVSVRHGQASPLSELRHELESEPERLALGPVGVLAAVVARVVSDYRPALDGFEKDALEVEREVFSTSGTQPVRRLFHLKREVRSFQVALESLDEPLDRLIRHAVRRHPDAIVQDLSEAADQLSRTVNRTRSLSNLLDAALTASLAQTGVQQNEDMRRISAWVAMAAVPTLIAGIYGMNFDEMPELHHRFAYPVVLAVMGAIVLLLYRAFRRNGWL